MRNIDEIGSANRLVYEDDTYAIIGAAMDVYYRLGCGFLEPVYQEALELELGLRSIPFASQTRLPIRYKDFQLKKRYRADFVCFNKIIVEIKAQSALVAVDWAQLLNYLKASEFRVGLLFNFGSSVTLEKKRLII
ncbi:MAG TPA: GxxExxY protein [Pyrinomonadaceae bacterium]|nr:GxxExxY protein [Pyrinomonadaceae bacterium]